MMYVLPQSVLLPYKLIKCPTCYGLNMSSPNTYVETPQCDVLGVGPLGNK